MTQKIVRGTVVQAYPSREGASGKPTPHNIVLEDGTKVSFWANKVQIDDVYSMIGNRYIFITSGSSEYNGVTTYTGEGFEAMTTPITAGTQSVQDGNGGEVEGSSSPAPQPRPRLPKDEDIIRTSSAYIAKDMMIAQGSANSFFNAVEFNAMVHDIASIIKGEFVSPETEAEDGVDPNQISLFDEPADNNPF